MNSNNNRIRQQGFTLLEILIAMLILSIIAIIMVRGLQIVLKSKARIEATSVKMEQLQLAMTLLRQDLQYVINRPIVNNTGQAEAALVGTGTPANQLSFTRNSFTNPGASAQRSTLQRVAYRLEKSTLKRLSWPVLDQTPGTPFVSRSVLSDLQSISWRFLGGDGIFYLQWPPINKSLLPKAVELQLVFISGSQLTQLMLLNASDVIAPEPPAKDAPQNK